MFDKFIQDHDWLYHYKLDINIGVTLSYKKIIDASVTLDRKSS